ncbi:MAG: NAD-dependent epimerase/dehydratase family protein [Dehalococcoidia bacterium]
MRILVAGGTGFVGSHTVAELIRAGHEVRLLVRDPSRIRPALAPFGLDEQPYVQGDVMQASAVESAMKGCDAVLHAASIYSLDVRKSEQMRRVNVAGTDAVLGAAHRLGLDPIVYVSSLVSLFPPGGQVLTTESPVKRPPGAYTRSKADAERVARGYQARGAPVVISYPSAVFGPHDPHFGESAQIVRHILAGRMRLVPRGGFSIVDVRDVAKAQAAMFDAGRGPRRYLLSGTHLALSALINTLADLTGRRIHFVTMPPWSLWPAVQAADLLQRWLPLGLPVTADGFNTVVWNPHGDDSESISDLGFAPRDLRDTLCDTVQWAYRTGNITRKQAGKVSSALHTSEN